MTAFNPKQFFFIFIVTIGLGYCDHLSLSMPTNQTMPTPSAPQLSAKSYLLMDTLSGQILADHDSEKQVPMASLTKLMTTYLTLMALANGAIKEEDLVLISEHAWKAPGSKMFVQAGHRVSVKRLLEGMVVASGNDAATALAEYIAGSEQNFVAMMNQTAQDLGMEHTHFENPTGLPHKNHVSTARDLARLSMQLLERFPAHKPLYKQKEFTYNKIKQQNRNKLLWSDKRVTGLKTGHTESSGYCLIASAEDDNMHLLSVVISSATEGLRNSQSEALLGYGFRFYTSKQLAKANTPLQSIPVYKGATAQVGLVAPTDVYVTLAKGQDSQLVQTIETTHKAIAPIQAGQSLGQLVVKSGDTVLAQYPLVAQQSIALGGTISQWYDGARLWLQENIG